MLIAISVGEPSGDILAAGLIREITKRCPEAIFFGIGGLKMQAEGCELLHSMDSITVMGFEEAIKNLYPILTLRKQLAKQIIERKPDVFIGVDAPDFNIGLAMKLKRVGFRTMHYVSPTVWAWRSYRIHKIKRAIDHMLVLFPFEKTYYDEVGLPATFVGHPAAKDFEGQSVSSLSRQARSNLSLNSKWIIGLMPGSRTSEVESLLTPILESARQLAEKYSDIEFVLPFANERLLGRYKEQVESSKLPIKIMLGNSHEVMQASNMMILASGTAALEALLNRVPMVVIYKISTFTNILYKLFRSVEHFSMPNHLLVTPKVLELLREQVTAENIVKEVQAYINDPEKTQALQHEFTQVAKKLAQDSDVEAAKSVLTFIHD
ncbi:MAG: lipid-A-disaccharide synthase [Gammaproteobacteria bacterium]|jgi:lipid-A-disaccharide synthase